MNALGPQLRVAELWFVWDGPEGVWLAHQSLDGSGFGRHPVLVFFRRVVLEFGEVRSPVPTRKIAAKSSTKVLLAAISLSVISIPWRYPI
jgi:hypothetical protein